MSMQATTVNRKGLPARPLAASYNPRANSFRTSEREPAWNDAGEFNASSKQELVTRIAQMVDAFQKGEIVTAHTEVGENDEAQLRAADLQEAYHDPTGSKMKVMGDTIVEELVEVGKREGFTRTLWGVQRVPQGQDGKVRIRYKQAVAIIATSATTVRAVRWKERYIRPPVYYLNANLLIEDVEVRLSPVGIMEEMFEDGLEALMVAEDKLSIKFLNALNGIFNVPLGIVGQLSPEIWAKLKSGIEGFGNPAATAVMAYDFWPDIHANAQFTGGATGGGYFDPVTKYQLVLEGRLGSLMGVNIITDAFREPKLRVLTEGQLYMVAPPNVLGVITQHQELTPYQVDLRNQGQPVQGWFLEQLQGQVAQNPRAVFAAFRV